MIDTDSLMALQALVDDFTARAASCSIRVVGGAYGVCARDLEALIRRLSPSTAGYHLTKHDWCPACGRNYKPAEIAPPQAEQEK